MAGPSRNMKSMWDSIDCHTIPVDRLAAIVTSSRPWFEEDIEEAEGRVLVQNGGKRFVPEDHIQSLYQPPPAGVPDRRGMRSKYFLVVGFAHWKTHYATRKGSRSKNAAERCGQNEWHKRQIVDATRKSRPVRKAVFYMLRDDGAIEYIKSGEKMQEKMRKMDLWYEEIALNKSESTQ